MSKDITTILAGWDFNPDELQVRIIAGDDGRERIQTRVDLGVLQMELAGRPDGQKPHGFESLLDFYEAQRKVRWPQARSSLSITAPAAI